MRQTEFLDQLVEDRAETDPRIRQEWASMQLMIALRKEREAQELTQAQVAERMGLPQSRITEIERRPWSASLSRILSYASAIGIEVGVLHREAA